MTLITFILFGSLFHGESTLYVGGTNAADSASCGTESAPCATLHGGINAYPSSATEIKIAAGLKITETESSDVESPLTLIIGDATNPPTISCTLPSSQMFRVSGQVTFKYLKFELLGAVDQSDYSLISSDYDYAGSHKVTLDTLTIYSKSSSTVYSGNIISTESSLLITNCQFSNFTLCNYSLLSVLESRGFVCSGSTFTNIVKQSDDGSVMELSLDSEKEVSISNCKFDSCKCENGNGGAICVYNEDDGGKLSMSGVTFTNCEAHRYEYPEGVKQNAATNAAATRPDVSYGGGMYVELWDKTSFSFSDMTFSGCKATYGSQFFACTSDPDLESMLYSKELWDGLLSGDSKDNEFILAVVSFDEMFEEMTILSSKQVKDVAPPDPNKTTIIIIVVVVVVVVIIAAVVAVILILYFKHLACFSKKQQVEDSKDNSSSETEMEPKTETKVEVPPATDSTTQ